VNRLPVLPGLLLASLLLALAPQASAQTPAAIQPGELPLPRSTESEIWYGMDQAEKEIRLSPMLVRDPALNAYVHSVACKVTRDYCKQLRVYIIDAPVFNAAMAPNGAMLVFTGSLLRMQDESELALVLGHEFAHFRQRHSLKYWEKAKRTSAVLATFSVVTSAGGVSLAGGLAQMAGAASIFDMSRQSEREADTIGFQQAVSLGYDPQAGVRIWTSMLKEERATKLPRPAPIFASHPRTAERLQDITASAAAMPAGDYLTNRDAYRSAMRPFLVHWLDAELSRRIYGASIQLLADSLAIASADSQGTYTYYLAEAYRRRNQGDDRTVARGLYETAITHPDTPADVWREHGLALREAGRNREAAEALRRYLERTPRAPDRAFVQQYLSELEKQP